MKLARHYRDIQRLIKILAFIDEYEPMIGQARCPFRWAGAAGEDSQMIDLILRNARIAGQDSLTDLGVDGGVLTAVGSDTTAAQIIDLAGRLVTPPLVEPHIHLDAVLTVGQPRPNVSGSLFEGIAVWAERVADLTLRRRAVAGPADPALAARQRRPACAQPRRRLRPGAARAARPGRPARGGARPDRPSAGRLPAAGHPRLRRRPGPHAQGRRARRRRRRRHPALRADPRGRRGVGQVRDGPGRRARPARSTSTATRPTTTTRDSSR